MVIFRLFCTFSGGVEGPKKGNQQMRTESDPSQNKPNLDTKTQPIFWEFNQLIPLARPGGDGRFACTDRSAFGPAER